MLFTYKIQNGTIKKKEKKMQAKQYIGKAVSVVITNKKENWYIAQMLKDNVFVYIEDTKDYAAEELLNTVQKCIILEEKQGKLIGFLLSNRKFVNDIIKIDKMLKEKEGYHKIKDIYLMERLKIKGKVVGLYLVDKGDIGIYYLDTKEIGTYVKKIKGNHILLKEKTVEEELAKQIKDVVQSIDLSQKEISLRAEQEKQKHLIEKALGWKQEREIMQIVSLDLEQKLEETQEQNNEKIRNQVGKSKFWEPKKQSKETDINIKQEMEMNDKVTDMKTLGKVLEKAGMLPKVEGKEFVKLGVIESNERDNLITSKGEKAKANTTRYAFVAIAKDGSVVPLDLKQDHAEGNNPRETNYQVNQKGEVVQEDVLSRYKIGEGTLAIKNGNYGEIKVYHSPRKTIGGKGVEGNKSLDRELETDNVWSMKKEERDLSEEYADGYRSVEESYQEAKLHEDDAGRIIDQDKMKTKDIDGDINTRTHAHDEVDYNRLAVKWGYYREGEPNADRAQELFEEKRKENPEKETKEIIEMVTEDLEEEMGNSRETR